MISVSIIPALVALLMKNLQKSKRVLLVFITAATLVATLFSHLYFDLYFDAPKRFEDRCEIEGKVESIDFDEPTKSLLLDAKSINDRAFSAYKLKVYLTDEQITNVTVGTKIRFSAELNEFDSYNSEIYYKSNAIAASVDEVEDIVIISQDSPGLSHKISNYRKSLSRKLVMYSGRSAGGLLSTLLFGERDYLNGQIDLDFERVGLSHVLAISGMHLVILTQGFSSLLALFGINKRYRKILEIIFTLGYMALVGFPITVVRAGIMLIISSLLFLLKSTRDSVTNLFLSVTFILIIQPYSVFDLSLWLSCFATLGIIICAELFSKVYIEKKNYRKKLIFSIITGVISCVFANLSILVLQALSFKSISLFALVTTPAFSPLILVFMYVGIFLMLTGAFLPIGKLVGFLSNVITLPIGAISSIEFASLSTDFFVVKLLICAATIFFFMFLILDVRNKKIAIATLSSMLVGILICSLAFTLKSNNKFHFTYNENAGSEQIFINENGHSTLIDISLGKEHTAYATLEHLKENKILHLDNLIIPSYSPYLCEGLEKVLSSVSTERVYMLPPHGQDQGYIIDDVSALLESYRTELIIYPIEKRMNFGSFSYYHTYSDTSEKCAFTVLYKDEFYSYVSSDMLDGASQSHAFSIMVDAKLVIIGAKGASGANEEFIYKLDGDTVIYYNNNKKDLPSETLEYYQERLTVDPNGSIDLYVE
ncbi:MAG: ComEC/Rec2 family competence protein [Clostridia bacterium]|nr:ComEC/Rec2 family competence protein [Clostridia bacterium]